MRYPSHLIPKGVLAILLLLGLFSCSPQTPQEYYDYAQEQIKSGQIKEAQKALLTAYLSLNGHYLAELPRAKKQQFKVIPQNGHLLYIAYRKKVIRVYFVHPTEAGKPPLLQKQDQKIVDKQKTPAVELYTSSLADVMLNAQIGPDFHIGFYDKSKGRPRIALYQSVIKKKKPAETKEREAKEGDIPSPRIHEFLYKIRIIAKDKKISPNNDLFFYKHKGKAHLAYYRKGSIYSYNLTSQKRRRVVRGKRIPMPYHKIGAFLAAYPSADWEEWGLLVGGGGAYRFYHLDFSGDKPKRVNRLKRISSRKIVADPSFAYLVIWRGGSGERRRLLIDMKQKKAWPFVSMKRFWHKIPKTIRQKDDCQGQDLKLETITQEGKIIFACHRHRYWLSLQNFQKGIKDKDKSWGPVRKLRYIGDNAHIDPARGLLYTTQGRRLYVFPLAKLYSPDPFSRKLLRAFAQSRRQKQKPRQKQQAKPSQSKSADSAGS